MPKSRPPSPDDLLCFAVYSASHAFNRFYAQLLAPHGITYPQYVTLVCLWGRDGQTVGELGDSLGLESSTLSPLLKRMESMGLITRSRDSRDERQVRIALTDQSRSLRDRLDGVPRCVGDALGLTIAEIDALRLSLGRMNAALDEATQAARDGAVPRLGA